MCLLFAVGCQEDTTVLTADDTAPTLAPRGDGGGDDGNADYVDNTNAIGRAATFRATIDDLRVGVGAEDAFTWSSATQEMETMINVYAADVSNTYANQTTQLFKYSVPDATPTGADVLALYEGIRTDLLAALADYDDPNVTNSIGLQVITLAYDDTEDAGPKVHVLANIGEPGSVASTLPFDDAKWASSEFPTGCRFRDGADAIITSQVNAALRGVSVIVNPNNPRLPRTIPEVRGVVNVTFSAEVPGFTRGSDIATLDNRQWLDDQGYTSAIASCVAGPYPDDGQFRFHYDCSQDELCFSEAKVRDYFADHNIVGDGDAKFFASQAISGKFFRIGGFVIGSEFIVGEFVDTRAHNTTYYYGDLFPSAEQIDIPLMP